MFVHDSEHHDVPEFLTREITGEVERLGEGRAGIPVDIVS